MTEPAATALDAYTNNDAIVGAASTDRLRASSVQQNKP